MRGTFVLFMAASLLLGGSLKANVANYWPILGSPYPLNLVKVNPSLASMESPAIAAAWWSSSTTWPWTCPGCLSLEKAKQQVAELGSGSQGLQSAREMIRLLKKKMKKSSNLSKRMVGNMGYGATLVADLLGQVSPNYGSSDDIDEQRDQQKTLNIPEQAIFRSLKWVKKQISEIALGDKTK